MTHIRDWDTQQVVEWVESEYKKQPKRAAAFRATIEENEYSGKELLGCDTVKDLSEALDIAKKIHIKGLFEKIQAFKVKVMKDIVDEVVASPRTKDANEYVETQKEIEMLIQIFSDLFQIKRNKDKDDEKAEVPEEDEMIKKFIETVKQIAATTKDFVKSLMGVKLRKSVTDEIISICSEYYRLLKRTTIRFGLYGSDIKVLGQLLSEISHTFLLPSKVMERIRGMTPKNQQETIIKLREETCSKLQSSTKQFSTKLEYVERHHVKSLRELSGSWLKLNGRIMKLLSLLKDSSPKLRAADKPMGLIKRTMRKLNRTAKFVAGFCLKWVAAPFAFAAGVAGGTAVSSDLGIAGLGLCAVGGAPLAIVGGVALIAGSLASAVGCGAATGAVAAKLAMKGDRMMNDSNNESRRDSERARARKEQFAKTEENISQIKIMKSALARMSTVSQGISNVINLEIINFQKIKDYDPHAQLNVGGFSDMDAMCMNELVLEKIHELGSTVLSCTAFLNKSKENIEKVERACTKEMNSFGENVHAPLIDMLIKDKGMVLGKGQVINKLLDRAEVDGI